MNLSTVKWTQWDKTQSRELLGLFICVCIALCTIVAQNRPDNFASYPPDNHHCSDDVYLREGGLLPPYLLQLLSYYQLAKQLQSSPAPLFSKPAVTSYFCMMCLFYSYSLGVEFSRTWPSVCSLTRLLQIPLKDDTVLCRLYYIAQFTDKQHIWFACDLGHYIDM